MTAIDRSRRSDPTVVVRRRSRQRGPRLYGYDDPWTKADRCSGCGKLPPAENLHWPHCPTCHDAVCYVCRDDHGRCPICAQFATSALPEGR